MKNFALNILIIIIVNLMPNSYAVATEKPFQEKPEHQIEESVRKSVEVKASMEVQIRRIQKLFVKNSSNRNIFNQLQSLKIMYRQQTKATSKMP